MLLTVLREPTKAPHLLVHHKRISKLQDIADFSPVVLPVYIPISNVQEALPPYLRQPLELLDLTFCSSDSVKWQLESRVHKHLLHYTAYLFTCLKYCMIDSSK